MKQPMKQRFLKAAPPMLALCFALTAQHAAHAADANLARNLSAGCANCHGTNGRTVSGTLEVNSLAGEEKAKLIDKLNQFRSGDKPATVMHQIARGYSDAQLELIAGWFAAQKK